MWKELKERLKFFGQIVLSLIIDALFLSAWVLINSVVEYIIVKGTAGHVPLYIQFPKYALDYAPPVVITCFVIADVIRSLKKLYNLIIDSLKGKNEAG